jgi:hypothetical protein
MFEILLWNDKIIDNPILPIELSSPEIQYLYVTHQDLHIKIQINPVKFGLNINACLWSFNYQLYLYVLIVQKVFVSFELVGVYIKSCYLTSICGICCLDVDYYKYLKFIIIPPLPEGGGGYTVLPLSVCARYFSYTLNIYAHFSSHFSQQLLMAEIWYLVTSFI